MPDVISNCTALTSDEVRIISIVIPLLQVVVLVYLEVSMKRKVVLHFPITTTNYPGNHCCHSDCQVFVETADRITFQNLLGNINTEHVYPAKV